MIKGLKIAAFLTLLVAFVACEKCERPLVTEDPFVNASDRSVEKEGDNFLSPNRGDGDVNGDQSGDGGITDPEEDEDYDGIVDPEEDEDFDQEDDGK